VAFFKWLWCADMVFLPIIFFKRTYDASIAHRTAIDFLTRGIACEERLQERGILLSVYDTQPIQAASATNPPCSPCNGFNVCA